MKAALGAFAVTFLVSAAFADPTALIFGGVRSQSGSAPAPSDANGNKTSFQLGVKASLPIEAGFSGVVGLGYTQRAIGLRSLDPVFAGSSSATATIYLNSIDVPILANYSLNDSFAVFAGPILAINLSSRCDSDNSFMVCTISDLKTVTIPLTIGFAVQLNSSLGFNVFYENTQTGSGVMSEFAKDVNNYRAIGANATFSF